MGICSSRVGLDLRQADVDVNVMTVTDRGLERLPSAGIGSVLVGIMVVEGIGVIAEFLKNNRKIRE